MKNFKKLIILTAFALTITGCNKDKKKETEVVSEDDGWMRIDNKKKDKDLKLPKKKEENLEEEDLEKNEEEVIEEELVEETPIEEVEEDLSIKEPDLNNVSDEYKDFYENVDNYDLKSTDGQVIDNISVISVDSALVDEAFIEDWYFNYFIPSGNTTAIIKYSDFDDRGVFANEEGVSKDIVLKKDSNGTLTKDDKASDEYEYEVYMRDFNSNRLEKIR